MTKAKENPKIRRLKVSGDDLRKMYIEQQMSQQEIANLLGCTQGAVYRQLKKHGIQARSLSESQNIRYKRDPCPKGQDHWRFKTGLDNFGYARLRVSGLSQKIHRLVAGKILGRPLKRNETVHHCNEIKTDNRPENLWVFPSQSAHMAYHHNGIIHPDTIFLKDHVHGT